MNDFLHSRCFNPAVAPIELQKIRTLGTGSHCANSVNTLLEYYSSSQPRCEIQSLPFSCVVNYNHVRKPHDVRKFRVGVRNIIEFGLGDRCAIIKGALVDLFPFVGRWDSKERSKRVHCKTFEIGTVWLLPFAKVLQFLDETLELLAPRGKIVVRVEDGHLPPNYHSRMPKLVWIAK